ncbi:MAG TPA: hypothetical protein VFW65_03355 [Pseudonocardiaceae bacterium]|nr:hypothetical protein [Pseudonocardiaceae bacterium]
MPDEQCVVLTAEPAARHRMPSADIILRVFGTPADGWRWTASVLSDYPGCPVAVAYDPNGRHTVLSGLYIRPGRPADLK